MACIHAPLFSGEVEAFSFRELFRALHKNSKAAEGSMSMVPKIIIPLRVIQRPINRTGTARALMNRPRIAIGVCGGSHPIWIFVIITRASPPMKHSNEQPASAGELILSAEKPSIPPTTRHHAKIVWNLSLELRGWTGGFMTSWRNDFE